MRVPVSSDANSIWLKLGLALYHSAGYNKLLLVSLAAVTADIILPSRHIQFYSFGLEYDSDRLKRC